ncbi:MAG: ester cyclase, partial [Chloroflexota bacterium]
AARFGLSFRDVRTSRLTHRDSAHARLAWVQAITDGDLSRFDALMTPDTRYAAATVSDAVGPQAVIDIYQGVLDGFPGVVYTPLATVVDGDYAAVRYRAEGVNAGEFRGNPATGNAAAWDGIFIMGFDCGRISDMWNEIDQLARMTALGTAKDVPVVRAMLPGAAQAAPASSSDANADADTDANAADCPPLSRREAEQVFFVYDEVWDTGEVSLLDGLFSPEAAASDPDGDGASLQQDIAGEVTAFRAAVPDLMDTADLVFSDGEFVVARWTGIGTMRGDYLGVPATGEPIAYTGITMLRLECGRIAEAWTEFDAAALLDAIRADWRP